MWGSIVEYKFVIGAAIFPPMNNPSVAVAAHNAATTRKPVTPLKNPSSVCLLFIVFVN